MSRCISCGRLPTEACCETCHRVAQALEREQEEIARQRGLDTYEDNFGFGLNTEEVNQ